MKTEMLKSVEELIKKAAKATGSSDAMHFAQAACNAANAAHTAMVVDQSFPQNANKAHTDKE